MYSPNMRVRAYQKRAVPDPEHIDCACTTKDIKTLSVIPRQFVVGANWRNNGDAETVKKLIKKISNTAIDPNVQIVVALPDIYLSLAEAMTPVWVELAAQNCWKKPQGDLTGEISAPMIKEVGATWVLLGTSDRRITHQENNELIAKKVAHALDFGLKVIVCIGETFEDRFAAKVEEALVKQITALVDTIGNRWSDVVLAYEPAAPLTPEQVEYQHGRVRLCVARLVCTDVAQALRIQYAGSVDEFNAHRYAAIADIDGFLVAGHDCMYQLSKIANTLKG